MKVAQHESFQRSTILTASHKHLCQSIYSFSAILSFKREQKSPQTKRDEHQWQVNKEFLLHGPQQKIMAHLFRKKMRNRKTFFAPASCICHHT